MRKVRGGKGEGKKDKKNKKKMKKVVDGQENVGYINTYERGVERLRGGENDGSEIFDFDS